MRLRINANAAITWHQVGDCGTWVMVVDEFLDNADELREFALSLCYNVPAKGDYYPGLKAFATLQGSSEAVQWVAERMLEKLHAAKDRPPYLTTADLRSKCTFAILACDRKKIPNDFMDQHTDNASWLATVLHLSLISESRGTALWKHRPSGLHTWLPGDIVQVQRLEDALGLRLMEQLARAVQQVPVFSTDAVQRLFRPNKQRRPFSIDEDEQWELLQYVPAKFNRLVAYPTWQIHSVVDTTEYERLTVENMRLTVNQTVEYPVPREFLPAGSTYPWEFFRTVEGLAR
jgi:hypothetical protein